MVKNKCGSKSIFVLIIIGALFSSCNFPQPEHKPKKAVAYKNGKWIINVVHIVDKHFAVLSSEELQKKLNTAQELLKVKLHKDIIFKLDKEFSPAVKDLIDRKTQYSLEATQYKIDIFNLKNKNIVTQIKNNLKTIIGCKALIENAVLYADYSNLKNLNCDGIIELMLKDYKKSIAEVLQNKSLQINKNNFKYYSLFNWNEATSFTAVGDSKSRYNEYYLFITNAPIIIDEAFFFHPSKIKFPFLLNFGTPSPKSTIVSYYPILTNENFENKNKIIGVTDNKSKDNAIIYELTRGFGKGFFGMPGKDVKGYNGCFLEYSADISFAKMSDIFAKTKPCDIDLRFSDYANLSRIVNYFGKTEDINKVFQEFKKLIIKYPESTAYQEQLALFYEQTGAKKLALKTHQQLINKLNKKLEQAEKNKRKNNFFDNEFIKLNQGDLKRVKSKIKILIQVKY